MDNIREFELNDWLVTEDGVCQVLGSQKYVVEPFFQKEYPSYGLGDEFENKLVCKILCGFDGKPRKSRYINHYSSKWCEPLGGKYLILRDKVQSKYPEQYKKFTLVKIKKPVLANVDFPIRVLPHRKQSTVDQINHLLATEVNELNFENVENLILKNIASIESSSLVNRGNLQTNALISLTYDVLRAKDKKFCFIGGKAFSVYCGGE
ncbi:hypothetical protein ACMZOO_16805 [Catenovulum sp. SX2]|uniref:hypothetical protein n=1 Tax=Catenovulum sp. SX2 TaxID=3398614 RepID=UPI003F82FCA2